MTRLDACSPPTEEGDPPYLDRNCTTTLLTNFLGPYKFNLTPRVAEPLSLLLALPFVCLCLVCAPPFPVPFFYLCPVILSSCPFCDISLYFSLPCTCIYLACAPVLSVPLFAYIQSSLCLCHFLTFIRHI